MGIDLRQKKNDRRAGGGQSEQASISDGREASEGKGGERCKVRAVGVRWNGAALVSAWQMYVV